MASLTQLLTNLKQPQLNAVPDWMWGAFRRRSISFANGLTDIDTRVFWLQTRGLTIDLRLPILSEQEAQPNLNINDSSSLSEFSQQEGWYAHSVWSKQLLAWKEGCSFQINNRWPEPAQLKRIGNCMIEFAPSGAYVEDWRLLNEQKGPLIGLELCSEKNLIKNTTRLRQGCFIACGQYAGIVLGRQQSGVEKPGLHFPTVLHHCEDVETRNHLIDFETSVGTGSIFGGYKVIHSLNSIRYNQELMNLNGFELIDENMLMQHLEVDGEPIERHWRIDTAIKDFNFEESTPINDNAQKWFEQESKTLCRYLQSIK